LRRGEYVELQDLLPGKVDYNPRVSSTKMLLAPAARLGPFELPQESEPVILLTNRLSLLNR